MPKYRSLTIAQFAQEFMQLDLFPLQVRMVTWLLHGDTIVIARRAGYFTAVKVANKIRVTEGATLLQGKSYTKILINESVQNENRSN